MKKNITILSCLLLIVIVLIGCILFFNCNTDKNLTKILTNNKTESKQKVSYVEFNAKVAKKNSNKNMLVHEDFGGNLKKDGKIVVINKDGSIRSLGEGMILVDGKVVKNSENKKFIHNTDSPKKDILFN